MFESIRSDENCRAVMMFFRNARRYVTSSGRKLIFLDRSGDAACLRQLAAEGSFRTEAAGQEGLIADDFRAEFYAFRLTPV